MKILSLNINGVKAFYNRDVLPSLLETHNPDILAFQETKANEKDTTWWLSDHIDDYYIYSNSSISKKGYAGVCFMIKKSINYHNIDKPLIDVNEYTSGRIISMEFNDFVLVNVYTLNSGSDKYELRIEWDEIYKNYLSKFDKPLILCGDFNVCHTDLDHYNRSLFYDEYPGCYEVEINGFTNLINTYNLIDVWRYLNPNSKRYTWFSYRANSYENNKGWGLDYFLVSNSLIDKVNSCIIDNTRVSDHHPVILDINL